MKKSQRLKTKYKAVLNRMRQKLKAKTHIQNPLIFKIKYLITQV